MRHAVNDHNARALLDAVGDGGEVVEAPERCAEARVAPEKSGRKHRFQERVLVLPINVVCDTQRRIPGIQAVSDRDSALFSERALESDGGAKRPGGFDRDGRLPRIRHAQGERLPVDFPRIKIVRIVGEQEQLVCGSLKGNRLPIDLHRNDAPDRIEIRRYAFVGNCGL